MGGGGNSRVNGILIVDIAIADTTVANSKMGNKALLSMR